MLIQYFRFGLISCLLYLTIGCNKQTTAEDRGYIYYIYSNNLDIPLTFEYHYSDKELPELRTVRLGKGEKLEEEYIYWKSEPAIIFGCDSVRIVFNEAKELWYFSAKEEDKQGNIFMIGNYKEKEIPGGWTYYYDIDKSIYDLSTDIIE